ncbi:hypothetical protein M6B38_341255 [Iris pallida]|uniref:Uncharacterized protein n=1 Tax=Iris pallida TaxID=29817 RepID=A0AAX6GWJ9_IRIPA|nr:hypothetical protein M6B38_341255 [Iris pallida]
MTQSPKSHHHLCSPCPDRKPITTMFGLARWNHRPTSIGSPPKLMLLTSRRLEDRAVSLSARTWRSRSARSTLSSSTASVGCMVSSPPLSFDPAVPWLSEHRRAWISVVAAPAAVIICRRPPELDPPPWTLQSSPVSLGHMEHVIALDIAAFILFIFLEIVSWIFIIVYLFHLTGFVSG